MTKPSTRVKTGRKGLFGCGKASRSVFPQDGREGPRSLGPCTVLLGESTDFGLKSPGEGHGNPFQYSGLENSMVHGVAKS